MSSPAALPTKRGAAALQGYLPLLAVAGAAAVLYAPTLAALAAGHWQMPAHSHGPVLLIAALALFALSWHRAAVQAEAAPAPWPRVALLLGAALALHALGALSSTVQISMLALPPLLAGLTLWAGGPARLRAQGRFPYVFLLFLVPWPVWMTDPLTQPLKLLISGCAEHLLHGLGYAVARDGVVLQLGAYQLHVADACSGIHSLFMLEAFGLLYIHLLRQPSALRQAALAALILPISFTANLLRVLALALLTYHGGSALGQGVLHEGSGLLLFALALLMLAPVDALLRRVAPSPPARPPLRKGATLALPDWRRTAPLLAVLLALAAWLQHRPNLPELVPMADLQQTLPAQVGGWRLVAGGPDQVVLTTMPGEAEAYDQQVVRTYADTQGRLLMLNIALVRRAADLSDLAHDPLGCYPAQGFQILDSAPAAMAGVDGRRLLARRSARLEAVSYWLRSGNHYNMGTTATRMHLMHERLAGRVPDSLLARASLILRHPDDAAQAHAVLEDFLAALVAASPPATRALLRP